MSEYRYRLGFIGAGNMAEAIARAGVSSGVLKAEEMIAADPTEERREVFGSFGVATTAEGTDVVRDAEQVLLAIKPQTLSKIGGLLGRIDREKQVVISIMAGVGSRKIEEEAGGDGGAAEADGGRRGEGRGGGREMRVVRVMPNTPLLAGEGMAGVALGAHAREGDDALALALLSSAGEAVRVTEPMIDAVTAVSGSGPAYVFYLAEAMETAAMELGLGDDSRRFVGRTLLGAAKLLMESADSPAELRRKVTSPGGTTAAAIGRLDEAGVKARIVGAVRAAAERSAELGRE